jgi:LPS sulfotransferase NodH
MTNSPPDEAQHLALDHRKQARDVRKSGCPVEFFNRQSGLEWTERGRATTIKDLADRSRTNLVTPKPNFRQLGRTSEGMSSKFAQHMSIFPLNR